MLYVRLSFGVFESAMRELTWQIPDDIMIPTKIPIILIPQKTVWFYENTAITH